MVQFVDLRDTQVARPLDFTRVSEGFKAPGSLTGKIASETGALLGDIGKTFAAGAAQFNEDLGEVAKNVAKDEVSKMLVAEGIDDGRLPDNLVKEIQGLKDMKEAADAGSIDPAGFNVKLLAATKRLKTQWAGHHDAIDKGLREMGYTPAQDVKNDRIAAAKKAAADRDAKTKSDAAFETWAIKQAPIAVLEWQRSGGKGGIAGLKEVVLKHGAQEANLKLHGQVLENEIKAGNATKQKAEAHLQSVGSAIVERSTAAGIGTYAAIQEGFKQYNKDVQSGSVQPGQLEMLNAQTAEWKRQIVNDLTTTLMKSPGWNVDSDTSKKVLANNIAVVDNLIAAITNKDINTGGLVAAATESMNQGKTFNLLNDPTVLHVSNIKKLLGESGYEQWRLDNPGIANAFDRAIAGDEVLTAITGKDGNIKNAYERLQREGVKDPVAYNSVLHQSLTYLRHPDVPLTTKQNIFNYLYSDKNIGMVKMLNERDQTAFFAIMASPENYKLSKELAVRVGDRKFEDRYKKMLVTSFADMNEQTGLSLNNIMKFNETHALHIDPTTMQLKASKLVEPVNQGATVGNWIVGGLNSVDQSAIDRFNTTFSALIPIYEANGLSKFQIMTEMNAILKNLGVDLHNQVKEKPLSRRLLDMLAPREKSDKVNTTTFPEPQD